MQQDNKMGPQCKTPSIYCFFSLTSTVRISPSPALGDGDMLMIRDSLEVPLCITGGLGLASAFGSSFCAGGADEAAGSTGFFSSFSGFFSASASGS